MSYCSYLACRQPPSATRSDALAYVRFTAQQFAAMGSHSQTPLDTVCTAASKISSSDEHAQFLAELGSKEDLRPVYLARKASTRMLLRSAAATGQVAALKWLRALCHRTWADDTDLMELAADCGQLSTLKYLCSGPCPAPWTSQVLSATMTMTSEDACLMWLLAQTEARKWTSGLVAVAAEFGNIPALQYLRDNANLLAPLDLEWSVDATETAAAMGHLAVLQWLRSQDPKVPWDTSVCYAAAAHGNMSMLQWARSQDPPAPWDASVSAAAAENGNLDILTWLQAQQPPVPMDTTCTQNAARAGRLDVLQSLRRQQPPCPWSEATTSSAAQHGHLHVLQWLRRQDPPCPWDATPTFKAVQADDPSMLQWLLAQQPPCHLHSRCAREAVCQGSLQMVQLISDHGQMPSGHQYWNAAQLGHLDTLRWLHRKKVPVLISKSSKVCGDAISSPIMLFLGDISNPMPSEQVKRLMQIRKACCTFYGLLRWCRRAVSDPSRGINRAIIALSTNATGQNLLVRLSMLPVEVLDKIALAAGLRHTLFQDASDDHLYPPPDHPMTRNSRAFWKILS